MLRVDLARLEREQSLQVEGFLEPDEHSFAGCAFVLEKPLPVVLSAMWAGSGELVLRGSLKGSVVQDCRRCLEPVERVVSAEITMIFTPSGLTEEEDDENTRVIEPGEREIDLGPHLRDELILAVPMYVECRTDCRGLCAGCGLNLNETDCRCSAEDVDPRWDALRAPKSERT